MSLSLPIIAAVVLGVIGAVVLIGLLTLLLWKVLTSLHDRREFARFENERKNLKFGVVSISKDRNNS